MRGNAHVRFGGRGRADHRAQARHGGSPPTLHRVRPPQSRNVKRWQSGDMALRWTAGGMLEAEQQFRRVIGYRDLAKLAVAIERDLAAKTNLSPTAQQDATLVSA
jgi:hypothetical protein